MERRSRFDSGEPRPRRPEYREDRTESEPRRPRERAGIRLIRTRTTTARILRLLSRILLAVSLIAHIIVYIIVANAIQMASMINMYAQESGASSGVPFGVVLLFIFSFAISAFVAWLIGALAEPFEQLRNCSDALVNIEAMKVYEMQQSGAYFHEEFH